MRFITSQVRPAKSYRFSYLTVLAGLLMAVISVMASAYAAQDQSTLEQGSPEVVDQPAAVHVDTVNINTADAETLALALDGVGLTRALDIIAYREEYGDFRNVEQIQQVRGIGIATFARNRTRMRVSDAE